MPSQKIRHNGTWLDIPIVGPTNAAVQAAAEAAVDANPTIADHETRIEANEASTLGMPTIVTKNYTRHLSRYASLAAAIADLPDGGQRGGDIQVDGDVLLTEIQSISSPVNIIGRGMDDTRFLAPATIDYGDNIGLFELIDVAHVALVGFTIDSYGGERSWPNLLNKHILINNASHILVEDVGFMGGGYAGAGEFPSGPYIEMMAIDDLTTDYPGHNAHMQVGGVDGVTVRACEFRTRDQGGFQFAIRMLSEYETKRDPALFVHHVRNVTIEDNDFLASANGTGFGWNTVTMAGGGTTQCVVRDNRFAGRTLSHVDADKGAYGNRIERNTIQSAGKPSHFVGDSTKLAAGINVHALGTGPVATYVSRKNEVRGNTIKNVVNPADTDAFTAAIQVAYAEDTVIADNIIENVQDGLRGRGIFLGHHTPGTLIEGNQWQNVFIGISTNTQAGNRQGITIRGNRGSSSEQAIHLYAPPGPADAASGSFEVSGNHVTCESATVSSAVYVSGTYERGVVADNQITGGNTALVVDTPGTTVSGNLARGTNYGIRSFRNDSTYIGNVASGALLALRALDGNVPAQHGNSWQRRVFHDVGIPTVGTYQRGDMVININPAPGGAVGWVCVTAGTPGTWKAFGAIEP